MLQAEAAVDGWYTLLTTLTPKQADAAEVLRRHKGQQGRSSAATATPRAPGRHPRLRAGPTRQSPHWWR
ncbi:hypothetical protein [Streptomyces sp. TP-A0356]|uniref:hypothetical protein n=1 Tax=Streptomyces sp. TP-A0356 TaxID=1359208 RepID=UPI000B1C1C56|nr:hypothetical protein [Streptomyces sp. TP-A0356]